MDSNDKSRQHETQRPHDSPVEPLSLRQIATSAAGATITSTQRVDSMVSGTAAWMPRHSNTSNSSEESNGFVKIDHRLIADFPEDPDEQWVREMDHTLRVVTGERNIDIDFLGPTRTIGGQARSYSAMDQSEPTTGFLPRDKDVEETAFDKAAEVAHNGIEKAGESADSADHAAANVVSRTRDETSDLAENIREEFEETIQLIRGTATDTAHHASAKTVDVYGKVIDAYGNASDTAVAAVESGGKALVGMVHTAKDELSNAAQTAVDTFREDVVRSEVAGLHDQIDSMIQNLHANSGQDNERASSVEEHTFDRSGPLTILADKPTKTIGFSSQGADDDILKLEEDSSYKRRGFETTPRPPTPPKELDDEDMKPTVIDVGQPVHKASSEFPKSILKHGGHEIKFSLKSLNPKVLDVIYWRDPKKSGAALAAIVVTLLIFAKLPLLTVLSYLGLGILGGTLGFRLYKLTESQIKKSDGSNPFQPYISRDFYLPPDKVHQYVDIVIENVQLAFNELKRLILVDSIADSLKLGLLLWSLTYISHWFSGLCILIMFVLAIFTIPKVYEVYQEPIDKNLTIAKQHVNNVTKQVNEKMPPFLKMPEATHEKST